MKATYAKRAEARRLAQERQAFLDAGGSVTQCPTPDWDSFSNKKAVFHGAMTTIQGGVRA